MKYKLIRRIIRTGDSKAVAIPRFWLDANDLDLKSEVVIIFDETPVLRIVPANARKEYAE